MEENVLDTVFNFQGEDTWVFKKGQYEELGPF